MAISSKIYLNPRARDVVYYPGPVTQFSALDPAKIRQQATSSFWSKLGTKALTAAKDVTGFTKIASLFTSTNSYTFHGVSSVDIEYARDVAVAYGLQGYSMVPWYTKAVVLTVTGIDYIGAFVSSDIASILAISKHRPVLGQIRDELKSVDNTMTSFAMLDSQIPSLSSTLLSAISVGTIGDDDSVTLYGFISKFTIHEDTENIYQHKYSLHYLGIDREWVLTNPNFQI